jgi:hypothetical protein
MPLATQVFPLSASRNVDIILAFAGSALNTNSRLLFYPRMLYFATISIDARVIFSGARLGDGQ